MWEDVHICIMWAPRPGHVVCFLQRGSFTMAAIGDLMVRTIDMHAEHNIFIGLRSQLCYPIPCLNNDLISNARADENLAMNLERSGSPSSRPLDDDSVAQSQAHQTKCTTLSEYINKTPYVLLSRHAIDLLTHTLACK